MHTEKFGGSCKKSDFIFKKMASRPFKLGKEGLDGLNHGDSMNSSFVIANGREIPARLPCTIEHFLLAQGLPPRSVVVEHNGEAVAPSEFGRRLVQAGDRLEVVRVVAGG